MLTAHTSPRLRAFFLVSLLLAPMLRADDAEAIAALRARVEEQAAQLEILRAELARLEAEVRSRSAPAAPPPTPPTPPAAAPAEPAVKFGGLIQGWYGAGDEVNDTFRIRRAELRVSGTLVNKAGFVLMIDPAKLLAVNAAGVNQASRILQDAFISVPGAHAMTFQVGQYRIPLSREGLEPAGALDTIERALFLSDRARGGNYGDVRDIGVSVRGAVRTRFEYNAGIFNGSGESQNDVDQNDRKTLAGRFTAGLLDGLRVGVSGAWGGPDDAARPRRDRLGGEALFTRGPWKLAAELMTGRDGPIERRGYYIHGGYRFSPRLEGIARVDGWDPDTSRDAGLASAAETDYTIGINLNAAPGLRFQANAIRKTFDEDAALDDRNLLLLNLQTSW